MWKIVFICRCPELCRFAQSRSINLSCRKRTARQRWPFFSNLADVFVNAPTWKRWGCGVKNLPDLYSQFSFSSNPLSLFIEHFQLLGRPTTLTFIGPKVSQSLQRILRPLNVGVAWRPRSWKWSLQQQLKDWTSRDENPGVVYRVVCLKCGDCEQSYIWETGRTACARVNEHAGYVRNGRFDMSAAAAERTIFEQHALDFDNVEVIQYERHDMKRRVKEALYINVEKNPMNKDRGLELNPNLVQPSPNPLQCFKNHSQAISQSFRVFITFRSMRETTFFHFSKLFLYKITVSFTMVIKRSPGGQATGGGRSTSKSACEVPAWTLTAFGDWPASSMSKFSASVNPDLWVWSYHWPLTSEMFTFWICTRILEWSQSSGSRYDSLGSTRAAKKKCTRAAALAMEEPACIFFFLQPACCWASHNETQPTVSGRVWKQFRCLRLS